MHIHTATLAVACYATAIGAQTPGTGRADSLVLTRRTAIAAALRANPQLEVGREQTAQARARRVSAIAVPDPSLTYSLDDQPGLLQLGGAGQKNAALELAVPFPDKFRLRNSIATADVRLSEQAYLGLRQQIAAQASRSYDSLLVAVRHRADFALSRDLAADFLKKTQARFEGGTVAKLDVIRAQVVLAQAENDLIASERDVTVAMDALDRVVGRPLGTPIVTADSLDVPPPLPTIELLQAEALRARPELAGLESARAGARATTSLAREFWLPDLVVGAQRDYGPEGSGALFSAGVALPLPLFYWQHSRGEIAESRHRERELSASYRDLQAQIAQDVRAAYASASTALRQAVYIRDALLPAAREAYRVASVSYGLGGSSALDVIEARRSLIDAQSQFAEALGGAHTSRADLELAVGRPLDGFPRSAP
ncbi:MAG TPA: TolC family protein [Gemmatimonadaceae bacterium]|jgi:cobalt-zinc-cadmium efflux system outer membrane protein|nr:TolC family protein [Gemmatimonadaceae bacterium]